jgi:hypothetical protein
VIAQARYLAVPPIGGHAARLHLSNGDYIDVDSWREEGDQIMLALPSRVRAVAIWLPFGAHLRRASGLADSEKASECL